jgi:hypothetical protein
MPHSSSVVRAPLQMANEAECLINGKIVGSLLVFVAT